MTYQLTGANDIPPDVHIKLCPFIVQKRADDALVSDVINYNVNNRNFNISEKIGSNIVNFYSKC